MKSIPNGHEPKYDHCYDCTMMQKCYLTPSGQLSPRPRHWDEDCKKFPVRPRDQLEYNHEEWIRRHPKHYGESL